MTYPSAEAVASALPSGEKAASSMAATCSAAHSAPAPPTRADASTLPDRPRVFHMRAKGGTYILTILHIQVLQVVWTKLFALYSVTDKYFYNPLA